MKTSIDIVTGFIGSEKTTYINEVLKNENVCNQNIVILSFENGEVTIDRCNITSSVTFIDCSNKNIVVDEKYIGSIIDKYSPEKMIIEYNGTKDIEIIFSIFESKHLRKSCYLENIIFIADCYNFENYFKNLGNVFKRQVSSADKIILNNIHQIDKLNLNTIKRNIESVNCKVSIFTDMNDAINKIYDSKLSLKNIMYGSFFAFVVIYLLFSIIRSVNSNFIELDFSVLKSFNTVFMGILVQAIPFMMVGMIISSFMQVFIPNEMLIKLFPQKYGIGFITAIFGGLVFPICECAIVPIVIRLIKKGVPLPIAITFMLAAPIVNPIVIISTVYAFPGNYYVTIARVLLGIVIAFFSGIVISFMFKENNYLIESNLDFGCSCNYCSTKNLYSMNLYGKIKSLFLHTSEEFFNAGKYLIMGAFITSCIQTFIPKYIFVKSGGNFGIGLIVMMIVAFLFSVCSTSDAFIARSFLSDFSISSIIGFLVFGPMIDIKNLLILFSGFKKIFVIKFFITVTLLSFTTIYFSILFFS